MENEIKEILDFIKTQIEQETISYEPDVELSKEEAKQLLDYITNLQEENEDLREDNWAYHQLLRTQNKREYRSKFLKDFQREHGTNTFPDYDEIYKRYDDYKSRCEKTIEKIESIRILGLRSGKTLISTLLNDLLDILQGSDNNE